MSLTIETCPACDITVEPMKDGSCPSCGSRALAELENGFAGFTPEFPDSDDGPAVQVQSPTGETTLLSSVSALREAVQDGAVNREFKARFVIPDEANTGETKPNKWMTVERFSRIHRELATLYRPIWSHTLKYAGYGAIIGVVLKALDTTWTYAQVDPHLAFAWLLVAGSFVLADRIKWAPVVPIIVCMAFGVGISWLLTAAGAVMLVGAVLGAPAGMLVGTIVGHVRKGWIVTARDFVGEGPKPYVLGLLLPALFLVVAIPSYVLFSMRCIEWMSAKPQPASTAEESVEPPTRIANRDLDPSLAIKDIAEPASDEQFQESPPPKIQVPTAVRCIPWMLFIDGLQGEQQLVTARVFGYASDSFNILGYELSDPDTEECFDVTWQPLSDEQLREEPDASCGYEVTLAVNPGLPAGPIRQIITFSTDSGQNSALEMEVGGRLRERIAIVGGRNWNRERGLLHLGDIDYREGARETLCIVVRYSENPKMEFEILDVSPAAIHVALDETCTLVKGSHWTTKVVIEVPAGTPPMNYSGSTQDRLGLIRLGTSHPDVPELQIHVSFSLSD